MSNALVIMGAGAMAREFLALVRLGSEFDRAVCVGTIGKKSLPHGVECVVGIHDALVKLQSTHYPLYVAVCVGMPSLRSTLWNEVNTSPGPWHYRAFCFGQTFGAERVDCGSIVFPMSVVATGAVVMSNAFVNFNCTIGHDTVIGESSVIAPGVHIGGHTVIGKRVFVGIGACIRDHVTIGDDAVIGAGAAVMTNIPPNVVVTGVPAKVNRLLTELREAKTHA